MQTSKLKMFGKLYSKEMRELAPEIVWVIGIAAAIYGYMYFKTQEYPLAALAPVFMIFGLAALMPLMSSFKLLGREWKNNTVYLMMSLPVKGGMVMGSKLTALLTQFVLGTLIAGVGGALLIIALNPEVMPEMSEQLRLAGYELFQFWPQVMLVYITSILMTAYVVSLSFFSQMVGKLVKRFSGLLTAAVFFFTFYIVGQIGDLFWRNIETEWLTNGTEAIDLIAGLDVFNRFIGLNLIFTLVITAVIFILTVIIYNRRVEL